MGAPQSRLLVARRAASLLLLALVSLVTLRANGEAMRDAQETSRGVEVVLGTIGLDVSSRTTLEELLRAELERAGLLLTSREPEEPLADWGTAATRSEGVLAALLLDARGPEGWRIVVIDAARGRAVARRLSGGIREDEASIEAVVSIAVSAALALREGLELASSPLADVVEDSPAPARLARTPARPVAAVSTIAPERTWRPRASVGASVASFSGAAPTTAGLAIALGVRLRTLAEARILGTLFVPAEVRSPLGDFRVARGWVGVAAGPVFETRAFALTPEVGILAERLTRFDATPAVGLSTTEGGSLYRVGGSLSLRLRRMLLRPLSAELVTGAVYFRSGARFSARSAETSWSTEAWPAQVFAQVGLEVAVE